VAIGDAFIDTSGAAGRGGRTVVPEKIELSCYIRTGERVSIHILDMFHRYPYHARGGSLWRCSGLPVWLTGVGAHWRRRTCRMRIPIQNPLVRCLLRGIGMCRQLGWNLAPIDRGCLEMQRLLYVNITQRSVNVRCGWEGPREVLHCGLGKPERD